MIGRFGVGVAASLFSPEILLRRYRIVLGFVSFRFRVSSFVGSFAGISQPSSNFDFLRLFTPNQQRFDRHYGSICRIAENFTS